MLNLEENVSLKPYNTFGVEVQTRFFYKVTSTKKLITQLKSIAKLPLLILGGGSNLLMTKDFPGVTLLMANKGITILEEKNKTVRVEVQAGENWHDFVLWCLEQNYGGVENLALIPGSVGAAPIQNIGAYGVELSKVFYSCQAINLETLQEEIHTQDSCEFGYRSSIFKTHQKGKYLITSVTFELHKPPYQPLLTYGDLKSKFEKQNPSIQEVANGVIEVRKSKLPDPQLIGNGGSFFKNPVISKSNFLELKKIYNELPSFSVDKDQIKIPAAWLIDYLGYKGMRFGQVGIHENQALVLVNFGGARGAEILSLAKKIQKHVQAVFGINLEMEVNIL